MCRRSTTLFKSELCSAFGVRPSVLRAGLPDSVSEILKTGAPCEVRKLDCRITRMWFGGLCVFSRSSSARGHGGGAEGEGAGVSVRLARMGSRLCEECAAWGRSFRFRAVAMFEASAL